ncbi:nuclear transport factor 2 family protein [Sinimarinibacterium sp. NLF-5-8]|uniref:nuclear transport factor 2 family protein n=1 Tax=Sinimarinibacterium sp. NLF-5-8 TaxID=2698684 RepID=UPI00137C0304|nr:nuclear transport factor 2 family protein [Sinimarinibacterium sp. NLF-5-8]QHS09971.1 nuclear transport factor 2 family protein [Sinimarinibacterium sp. NLF-5-8]
MHPELEHQLLQLLDKQAITELVHAYCNAADRHDFAKMRALYHDDAIDEHGQFSRGLARDFLDKLPDIQAPMAILHHNITTLNLKLAGDRAEGEVYLIAMHQVQSDEGLFDVLIGGRYLDKYQKRNGVWKFAHRSIVADWAYAADPSRVRLDHPFLSGAFIGKPGADDPSYGFFELLKRGMR